VGLATAKGLAAARGLPLAPVDHLQGHVAANFLGASFEPPFLCLVASGGHTFLALVEDHAGYTVLGSTLDDAAGEAFDKGAHMLVLPYPGGPALERLAADGDPHAYEFPIAAGVAGLDFSFAGLKTALLYKVRDLGDEAQAQRAVGGGVAANGPLRDRMAALGVELHVPERELCTDNAAMIASAARWVTPLRDFGDLDAYASGERGI
jgi:N6-L-threonylcarbamoyladenine synthase